MKAQEIKNKAIKTFNKTKIDTLITIELLKLHFASAVIGTTLSFPVLNTSPVTSVYSDLNNLSSAEPKEFGGPLASIADQVAADMKKVRNKQDMLRLAVMMQRNATKIKQLAQQI